MDNLKNYVEISFANSRLTKLFKEHITSVHPEHVKRYNFANNKISEIEDHAFDKCTVLEVLDMRKNKLTTIDSGWFQGLWDSLLSLELSDNEIATIPERAFSHLNTLQYLNLDGNPIVTLNEQTFYSLSFLRELSLDYTQISEVSESVFTNLTTPNLETLSIRKSKMERLPLLRDLKNLNQVDFSGNDNVQSVQKNTFAKVPSITKVSLDFMRNLQTIEECAFCGLTDLKFILISDSPRLTRIPKSAFDIGLGYGTNLDTVDFANNSLTSLHPKMFPWRSVKNIKLEGNKWNCSCEIAWMIERSINIIDNPKCASPSVLKLSPIKNVTKISFGTNCVKRASYRAPKVFIAMTIMLVISGGVLICWYVWSNRKQEGGIGQIFKTNPLVKQPYAYRNLAMHQEDSEQIVPVHGVQPGDQEDEDDAPYPPFDKNHINKASLV
jgi:Leucine-rich repeat (LRR) protein